MVAHRNRPLCLIAAFAASTLSAVPASANDTPDLLVQRDEATRLQPISQWNIDYGENLCRLVRLFGSEDDQHLVLIEQNAPIGTFGLTVAGDAIRPFSGRSRVHVGMVGDEPMERIERNTAGEIADIGPALILASVRLGRETEEGDAGSSRQLSSAGLDLSGAADAERIVVKRGGNIVAFETGNLAAPLEALNACTFDLLSDWGLDPEQHRSHYRPVWINQDDVVRRIQDNYPRAALNRGEQAIFRMRVIVEADGSVSQCDMVNATQTERLDSPACEAMMRAQFDPARDSGGNPMRTYYATAISYLMGG